MKGNEMSESLPTIKVKFKESGHEAMINATDFDAKIHQKLDDSAEAPATAVTADSSGGTLSKAQIMERLKELKVDFKATQSKAELEALLTEAEKPKKAKLSVEAKGDKFIIVNDAGEQQGDEFATAEEAQGMLVILGGGQ
jgi:hypothetical protein